MFKTGHCTLFDIIKGLIKPQANDATVYGCLIVAKFNIHNYIQYTHFIFNTLLEYSVNRFIFNNYRNIFNIFAKTFNNLVKYSIQHLKYSVNYTVKYSMRRKKYSIKQA